MTPLERYRKKVSDLKQYTRQILKAKHDWYLISGRELSMILTIERERARKNALRIFINSRKKGF